jgi:hypothetical protein
LFLRFKLRKQFPFNLFCLILKADGTKVAAGSDDGTVIILSYPGDGKQEFRRKGRSNFPLIVWNPFNRDMLASYNKAVSGRGIKRHKCTKYTRVVKQIEGEKSGKV